MARFTAKSRDETRTAGATNKCASAIPVETVATCLFYRTSYLSNGTSALLTCGCCMSVLNREPRLPNACAVVDD